MKYKVYFEVYGRKMVTTIEADTQGEAVAKVKDKLRINKVEPILEDKTVDFLSQIFWK